MRTLSTRAKATLTTAGFLILLTVVLVGLWLMLQGRYLRSQQWRKVNLVTDIVAEISAQPLYEANILRLAVMADESAAQPEVSRVMITDRNAVVIVDSEHEAYSSRLPIVARAFEQEGTVVNYGEEQWVGAAAIRDDYGNLLGGLMIEFPTDALIIAQRNARMTGLLIALIGIVAGSALAYFAARLLTMPLERLLEGIRQVQAGKLREPVPTKGGLNLPKSARHSTRWRARFGSARKSFSF